MDFEAARQYLLARPDAREDFPFGGEVYVIPRGELERMIDRSFALVVRKLTRKERQALEIKHGVDALYR